MVNKIRSIINNFGDSKAVVRESRDNFGNLVKIEVFYGGEYGGDSKGHGHFVAENIDGLFQVTLDRHPDKMDGGRHEIESIHKNNAYNDQTRQDRIQKKREIISQISYLRYDDPQSIDKLKELESAFYNVGSCGHEDNTALKQEFQKAKQRFYDEVVSEKERIISEAQSLLFSLDRKSSRDSMNRLFDKWKTLPHTTKDKDDELWTRFNSIRSELREKQRREYEEAKLKKEAIVKRAESLAYSTDYKTAKDEMKSLMEQWKNSPHASKQDEDALWQRFSRAREDLFTRAKQDSEKRQFEYNAARTRKESIISKIESLCSTSDFKSATEQEHSLSQQFYEAGNAGKDNQALKERFKNAKQRFYDAKRAASEQQHREYLQRMQDRLFQKQQQLSNLESAIMRTESSISELMSRPDPSFKNPNRYEIAARRNSKISEMNDKLRSMGERRAQLINQISELQSRIRS